MANKKLKDFTSKQLEEELEARKEEKLEKSKEEVFEKVKSYVFYKTDLSKKEVDELSEKVIRILYNSLSGEQWVKSSSSGTFFVENNLTSNNAISIDRRLF